MPSSVSKVPGTNQAAAVTQSAASTPLRIVPVALQAPEGQRRHRPHAPKDRGDAVLRLPEAALDEDDRDLGEPEAQAVSEELELDEKGIAVRAQIADVDALEDLPAEALE